MADDIRTAEMETELRHIREQARLGEPVDDTRAAVLDAELARIRKDAVAAGKVLLRVLPPHIAFTVAGHTVGAEPTPVPARLVTSMTEAASAAGVTLAEG